MASTAVRLSPPGVNQIGSRRRCPRSNARWDPRQCASDTRARGASGHGWPSPTCHWKVEAVGPTGTTRGIFLVDMDPCCQKLLDSRDDKQSKPFLKTKKNTVNQTLKIKLFLFKK
jgi:hypothetical protein